MPEIPKGYKQTEVGVIPEEWEVEPLSAFTDVKTGPFGSALHERDYTTTGTPIITVEHLGERAVVHENLPLVSDSDRIRLCSYSLRSEDIVFSRVGSVDRNAIIRDSEDGWLFSGRLLRVRVFRSDIHPPYLSYHFHSEPFKQRIRSVAVGQTMASLNTQIIRGVYVVLPTESEQRAIAAALSDADAWIESLEKLIEKQRAVKQGAMQALLTPPGQPGHQRLPGFKGEWEVRRIGDVVSPRTDRLDPASVTDATFCVELEHMISGTGMLTNDAGITGGCSLKSIFHPGDVLYGKLRAYLRKFWFADRPGVCSTEIWVLAADALILRPEYLYQVVQSGFFLDATNTTYGTHMPRSDWNVVCELKLSLPSLPEQAAIAGVLSDLDAEVEALEAKLAKARQIKQGMMQELLTGRVRLV